MCVSHFDLTHVGSAVLSVCAAFGIQGFGAFRVVVRLVRHWRGSDRAISTVLDEEE